VSATLRLAPVPSSVPEARRFVRGLLAQWSLERLTDTAVLLTSEVVTNAVLHARTDVEVTVTRMGDAVQVQVHDGSSVSPVQRRHSAESTTGRGVRLLDQLAEGWTVTQEHGGKTICFVVDASTDPWAAYGTSSWQDLDL
jgi:anti-sigma regulatory factor (Ser/Thr protein kinase)